MTGGLDAFFAGFCCPHAAVTSLLSGGSGGCALPPRFLRNTFHGAIGLPCQRVDGGTSSPRMTSEAGPTVAVAPIRAAGSATQWRPQRRTRFQHNGVHPHDPVVEQVGLHDAAPVDGGALLEGDQVRLGSQYVSHHTPRPIDAPSARSHRFITGVPVAARARTMARRRFRRTYPIPRYATRTTTRADAQSPGYGRRQAISRDHRDAARDGSRGEQHDTAGPAHWPASRIQPPAIANTNNTATPICERHTNGMIRQVSTMARSALSSSDGWNVRSASAAVRACGATEPADSPATTKPALALCGVAESTATSPSSGTRVRGWVSARVLPRNTPACRSSPWRRGSSRRPAHRRRPWCRRPGTRRPHHRELPAPAAPSKISVPRPTFAPSRAPATTA